MSGRRPSGRRTPKHSVLVFCQGAVTEVKYFQGVKEYLGAAHVQVLGQQRSTAPAKVVEEGIRRAREMECSEVFIVVDVDDFRDHERAIASCRRASGP